MRRLVLICAILSASIVTPLTPMAAKGPPVAPPGDCRPDISGQTLCAYPTREECRAALRIIRRDHPEVWGCWLSTADPDWWHYGKYVLQYWP